MDVPKLICNHLLLQKMWLDFEAELWLPMFILKHYIFPIQVVI